MKKWIVTTLLIAALGLAAQTADAQDRGFGIGGAIGGPDGISYKAWTSQDQALAGIVTFNASEGSSSFYTSLDYLFHKYYSDLNWEVGDLHYYYGGGAGFQWYSQDFVDEQFMLRLPAGFGFNFTDVPVDLFFELAPQIRVAPDFNFGFNGNLGFRFYLN
ncbi:MAG: hypothetical protein ACQER4_08135 [Bacteroidota bacterium]